MKAHKKNGNKYSNLLEFYMIDSTRIHSGKQLNETTGISVSSTMQPVTSVLDNVGNAQGYDALARPISRTILELY